MRFVGGGASVATEPNVEEVDDAEPNPLFSVERGALVDDEKSETRK